MMWIIEYLAMCIVIIIITFTVSKVSFNNGRINMCKELDYFYTTEDICLSCEETGRVWKNGDCVSLQNTISSNYDFSRLDLKLDQVNVSG